MTLVFENIYTKTETRYINVLAWHPVANKDAIVYSTSRHEWFLIDTSKLVLVEVKGE